MEMITGEESINEHTLYLFTDGASRKVFNEKTKKKSGRYGGEGIWLVYIDDKCEIKKIDLSDYVSYIQHTNNDMELKAVVDGLKHLLNSELIQKFHKIIVATDSDYVFSNRNRPGNNWSKHGRNNSSGFGLKHKGLRKDFLKVYKSLYDIGIRCTCERVKGHNGNEFNEMADGSAVAGARSKNRFPAEKRRGVRMPFLNEVKFDDNIEINGEKGLLIHVTNFTCLGKGWITFICEVVDWENKYFGYRFYISTNKALSSRYIYKVDIGNDKYRHIIENVVGEYSKLEIKEKILNAGISEDVFYKRK